MTYSIYLLHGPLLFIVFRFVLGFEWAERLDPAGCWGVIGLLTPLLLGVSICSYKKVELPCMRKTMAWTDAIKKLRG
jgi:peptidoglycan/LPS O-acetylase OafA/YrhL